MIRELLHRVFGCRHSRLHRERRTRFGCGVLHYVCDDCGHAVPIVERSAEETRLLFLDRMP